MTTPSPAHDSSGLVTRVEGGYAWVEIASSSSCGSCNSQTACGSGLLGVHATSRQYRFRNAVGARAGDAVTVSMPEGGVFRAAALAYLMPLALGLGGAGIGMAVGGSDAYAGLGLLGGIVGGWWLMRRLDTSREPAPRLTLKRQVVQLHPRFHEEP